MPLGLAGWPPAGARRELEAAGVEDERRRSQDREVTDLGKWFDRQLDDVRRAR